MNILVSLKGTRLSLESLHCSVQTVTKLLNCDCQFIFILVMLPSPAHLCKAEGGTITE